MIAREDYGTVLITQGEHAGTIGYYDDDIDELEAVVYIGKALFQEGLTILREHLEPTDEKIILLSLHRLLNKHPEVKDYFGLVLRG